MVSKEDLANAMIDLKETQKQTNIAIKASQDRVDRSIEAMNKETSEKFKETTEKFKETSEKIEKLGAYIGRMGNSQGEVAEEFFVNSLEATLTAGGIVYDDLRKNLHKYKNIDGVRIEGEFDIVLVNGNGIAILETKYNAHKKDLDYFIHTQYPKFKQLYPEYADYTHHLGLASFHIDEETKKYALDNNVMILQRKGDIIETTLPRD